MKKLSLLTLLAMLTVRVFAQETGTFSGDLMMNLNFFQRDTAIKAAGNPLYDNYLSGSEGWLDLRYSIKGFTFFVRADAFNNSNLYNPTQAMSGFGVGAWSITKEMKDLTISVGYIYDQIGSGILFRAYEDRGLLIDNALVGIHLKYKLTDNIMLKGFTGQQKFLFSRYAPIIKGFVAEGDFNAGNVHILPGVGVLNRTLDASSMSAVVATINSQDSATRFEPTYNMYAFTAYNTLTYKNLSWYAEGAYKTREAIVEYGSLVNKPGNVEFTTINYAQKGFALNLVGKRTQDFVMRTSPNEVLLNGMLNWQPIVAVLRTERLMSRYTPPSQDISEQAGTADLQLTPNDKLQMEFTYTNINQLNNVKLYREGFGEAQYRGFDSWIIDAGVQYLEYNLDVYETKPNTPMLTAVTPFTEITYKIDKTHSLRAEVQYMDTKQDYGSWVYALLEFNAAPRWSVSASDMYNVAPNYAVVSKANHYYNLYVAYTKGPHRFSLAYVKQVDGINCSGGVCRYEPAFSGVRGTITSSF